jgi:hypothetical protein
VLPPLTLRDRTTTMALDMLGHSPLMDKVFDIRSWSRMVMGGAHRVKPVKLIGASAMTHVGRS